MAFHIIADSDTVLGYQFAGVSGTVVATEEEAARAFREILQSDACQILLLTENVEALLGEAVSRHRLQAVPPYVVVIEDIWGSRGDRKSLQDLIYEAVGIRIVQDE